MDTLKYYLKCAYLSLHVLFLKYPNIIISIFALFLNYPNVLISISVMLIFV